MATNIICSNTGYTAHLWDGPYHERPGKIEINIVARCGKLVKHAVVISRAEATGHGDRVASEYVMCPTCKPEDYHRLPDRDPK